MKSICAAGYVINSFRKEASGCLTGHSGNPDEYLLSVLIVSFSDSFHSNSKNVMIIIRIWFMVQASHCHPNYQSGKTHPDLICFKF